MTTAATTTPPTQPDHELSRARLVGRRLVAAGIDLVLLPSMLARLGDVLLGNVGEWIGRALGVAGAIVLQGLVGSSFGMAVVGLVVVGADRGDRAAPGLRRSAKRHTWLLAPLLGLLPMLLTWLDVFRALEAAWVIVSVIGSLLSLVGLMLPAVLLGTIIADDGGRGLHDRWSGTAVLPTVARGRPGATIAILLLLWAALTGAAWWLGEPDRVDSDRLGSAEVQSATCDLRYDPPAGERQERTVVLARGMDRVEVRLGPHVARFDDEPFPSMRMPSYAGADDDGTEGLFYELRSPRSAGSSSGSSSGSGGSGSFRREIDLGGGLAGGLSMDCRGQDAGDGVDAFTPSVIGPSDQ